jgi:putative transposase
MSPSCRPQAGGSITEGAEVRRPRRGAPRPPVAEVITFMGEHRAVFGVEPLCRVLHIAPSTRHERAARRAKPDLRHTRAKEDEKACAAILRVHAENVAVYLARKVWLQLLREGFDIGRNSVARLKRLGLEGVRRERRVKTTLSDKTASCPLDKVIRRPAAPGSPGPVPFRLRTVRLLPDDG